MTGSEKDGSSIMMALPYVLCDCSIRWSLKVRSDVMASSPGNAEEGEGLVTYNYIRLLCHSRLLEW